MTFILFFVFFLKNGAQRGCIVAVFRVTGYFVAENLVQSCQYTLFRVGKMVDNDWSESGFSQCYYGMATDEAGATGNQNSFVLRHVVLMEWTENSRVKIKRSPVGLPAANASKIVAFFCFTEAHRVGEGVKGFKNGIGNTFTHLQRLFHRACSTNRK